MHVRYTRAQSRHRRAARDPRARSADTASVSTSVRRSASTPCQILRGRSQMRRGPDGGADRGLVRSRFPEGYLNQPSELAGGLIRNDSIRSEHAQFERARQRIASAAISDAPKPRARFAGALPLVLRVGMHKGCAVYSAAMRCQDTYNKVTRLTYGHPDAFTRRSSKLQVPHPPVATRLTGCD